MKKIIFLFTLIVAQIVTVVAANNNIEVRGHVIDAKTNKHIPYATITAVGTTIGTVSDETGHFELRGLKSGEYEIRASVVGYTAVEKKIATKSGAQPMNITFTLTEDVLAIDQVVVSASRTEIKRKNSPTLVSVMPSEVFEQVAAPTLADGLTYNTGVRVDNNCQNCGFTQVRINGLEGNYSQILIDSRPIFSSLAGVYGLESVPAAMVDRVEVVRGGGSALFGSSAIGGTINIITKTPEYSSAEIASTLSVIEGGSVDSNTTANATYVTENQKAGFTMFAQTRKRESYDANDDGYSEIPELESKTIGLRTFFKTSDYSKLSLQYDATSDYRRGGDLLDEPMEVAAIAESASHNINSGAVNFDLFSRNYDRKLNLYSSMQHVTRDSYYGGYGTTTDFTIVTGGQLTSQLENLIFMPSELVFGVEHSYSTLKDQHYFYGYNAVANPDYDPLDSESEQYVAELEKLYSDPTEQDVNTYSAFLQNEWRNDKVGILVGARADYNSLLERVIVSPRVNFRYNPSESVNFRATYSTGFRAPQLFDEDLHITLVGGEQSFIVLADDLKEEKSQSVSVSADLYKTFNKVSTNFLVEGFYTVLKDAFALSEHETAEGVLMQTRYNTSGAKVYGVSLEARVALPNVVEFQAGATLQRSKYDERQWDEDGAVGLSDYEASQILRSPDNYGYFTAKLPLYKSLDFSATGTYTGSMLVEHVLDEEAGLTDYINSKSFFDLNMTLSYDFSILKSTRMTVTGGVLNVFNSYQDDFDKGEGRDAGFVYGPMMPRRYTLGAKLSF